MGYITRDIARIPTRGFVWYVLLLEDDWRDSIREELSTNFDRLVKKSGRNTLVVRGIEPESFAREVLAAYSIATEPRFPVLLVSNLAPADAREKPELRKPAKTIVMTLQPRESFTGGIPAILEKLTRALRDTDALTALDKLDPTGIKKWWGWLNCLELKPNFMGFGVDLNTFLGKLIFGGSPAT